MIAQERMLSFRDIPDDQCIFPDVLNEKDIRHLPQLQEYLPSTDNLESITKICASCEEIGGAIIRFVNAEGPCSIDYALRHCTRGHFDALPASHPVHAIIRDWLRKSIWDSLARTDEKMKQDVLEMQILNTDLKIGEIEPLSSDFLRKATLNRAQRICETLQTQGSRRVEQLIGDLEGSASTDTQKTIARILEFWIYFSARKKLKNQRRDPAETRADDGLPS